VVENTPLVVLLVLKNKLVPLNSVLNQTTEETVNSPRSVIYRPVGSTRQCFLKVGLTSRRPNRNLPYLTFLVLETSDDGGLFPRLLRGALGNEGVCSVDSGRRHWFLFLVGGVGNEKRRRHDPWSSSYVHYMSHPQTARIYVVMFCIMSYII
jgi:hypothetical protein